MDKVTPRGRKVSIANNSPTSIDYKNYSLMLWTDDSIFNLILSTAP